jgi:hypothetical protein
VNSTSKDGIIAVELKAYNKKDVQIVKNQYEMKALSQPKITEFPKQWTNEKIDIKLYNVLPGSAEFSRVQTVSKIPSIKTIIRVENKLIWQKYME